MIDSGKTRNDKAPGITATHTGKRALTAAAAQQPRLIAENGVAWLGVRFKFEFAVDAKHANDPAQLNESLARSVCLPGAHCNQALSQGRVSRPGQSGCCLRDRCLTHQLTDLVGDRKSTRLNSSH